MKTLIFDLDGTLLDTLGDIVGACNEVLKRYGFPTHEIQAYKNMVGNGFTTLVKRALPTDATINMDDSTIIKIVEEAKLEYATHMTDTTRPYPEMNSILSQLQNNNNLAVLSNKPDELSISLVQHFFPEIKFLFTRGALPAIPLKPDPGALFDLLSDYTFDIKKTTYIGDSNVDILFARNTKMKAAGACWGFRGRKELEDTGADILLETPHDLLKI